MKSVTHKIETLRRAVAEAVLAVQPANIERLRKDDVPKKDVLVVAKVAAIAAAKNTPQWIPYCHPIPIDAVDVEFDVQTDRIVITVSVEAIWKTGVEMEALTAVSAAALTIYDMLKPIDNEMVIQSTRLVKKRGGKSDFVEHIPANFSAAVIVTSDGTAEGAREDRSGQIIKKRLESYGIHARYAVLPDEKDQILSMLDDLYRKGVNLILTTGGTGLGPRDVTVEATRQFIEREIPGVVEAARSYGQRRTPYAMLSRGLAGQRGRTLIVNLPGSSKGAEETLDAIFPAVLHSYKMMDGGGH